MTRILIVDDEIPLAEALSSLFELENIEAAVAGDRATAERLMVALQRRPAHERTEDVVIPPERRVSVAVNRIATAAALPRACRAGRRSRGEADVDDGVGAAASMASRLSAAFAPGNMGLNARRHRKRCRTKRAGSRTPAGADRSLHSLWLNPAMVPPAATSTH